MIETRGVLETLVAREVEQSMNDPHETSQRKGKMTRNDTILDIDDMMTPNLIDQIRVNTLSKDQDQSHRDQQEDHDQGRAMS